MVCKEARMKKEIKREEEELVNLVGLERDRSSCVKSLRRIKDILEWIHILVSRIYTVYFLDASNSIYT